MPFLVCFFVCLVAQLCPTLCGPMDCRPSGSSARRIFSGKNTGVGCHALLQEIFPTQILNPGLLDCRQILYHLSHQGSSNSNFSLPMGTCINPIYHIQFALKEKEAAQNCNLIDHIQHDEKDKCLQFGKMESLVFCGFYYTPGNTSSGPFVLPTNSKTQASRWGQCVENRIGQ